MIIKIFPGGSPEQIRADYKAWWEQQRGIEIIGTPIIEPAVKGWKLTVQYRETTADL